MSLQKRNFCVKILMCVILLISSCDKTDNDESRTSVVGVNGVFSVSATQQVQLALGNLEQDGYSFTSQQYEWGGKFQWGTGDWGHNIDGDWRTLSYDEWHYLLSERSGAEEKKGTGHIGAVQGLILLPDNWELPSGCSFTAGFGFNNSDWSKNSYTTAQWSSMEDAGAVFLPANIDGHEGNYWTSTPHPGGTSAYVVCFQANGLENASFYGLENGLGVRLAMDVE